MSIAPHHIPAALPAIVMPDTSLVSGRGYGPIAGIARAVPGPVTLNNFVGRISGNLAGFYWLTIRRTRRNRAIGCRVFDSEPVHCPHGKITVPPRRITRGL